MRPVVVGRVPVAPLRKQNKPEIITNRLTDYADFFTDIDSKIISLFNLIKNKQLEFDHHISPGIATHSAFSFLPKNIKY